LKNLNGILEKRGRLHCVTSFIVVVVFLMSACASDEGPAFLEIRNLPAHFEGMFAEVSLYAAGGASAPLFSFDRQRIAGAGPRRHSSISLPAQIPDNLRSTSVRISFRLYDNMTSNAPRLEGFSTRTIQPGTNIVRWDEITNPPHNIALSLTNVPSSAEGISINNAPAIISIHDHNRVQDVNIIALSRLHHLNHGNSGPIEIFDNYPAIGEYPFGHGDLPLFLYDQNWKGGISQRFFMGGSFFILILVGGPAGMDVWVDLGPVNISIVPGSTNTASFASFRHIGHIPIAPMAHGIFEPNLDFERQLLDLLARARQEHGLQ